MLFLLFQIGDDRYALEARSVVEVVPFVDLKRLPQAQKPVAGIFSYRGTTVAAIDLSELTLGRPTRETMSTRIIIVNCPSSRGERRLLGLVAEQATQILQTSRNSFAPAGLGLCATSYLGPVMMDNLGPIRLIQEQELISEHLRERLFSNNLPLLTETACPASV